MTKYWVPPLLKLGPNMFPSEQAAYSVGPERTLVLVAVADFVLVFQVVEYVVTLMVRVETLVTETSSGTMVVVIGICLVVVVVCITETVIGLPVFLTVLVVVLGRSLVPVHKVRVDNLRVECGDTNSEPWLGK